jgi:acyl dehydratase|tara:strand:+ start:825 stop:1298 length:474 start_codon:yes stop_codon:yes gene_type:complete
MSVSEENQLFASDFVIGQSFEGRPIEIGDDKFQGFAHITGDNHPIHYDDEYAATSRYGKRLAHGLLIVSMSALGATPMSQRLEESMVAFLEQGSRFLKPVFVGDTLKTIFEVAEVAERSDGETAFVRFDVRQVNQHNDIVARGHHCYLLKNSAPDNS